VFVFCDFERENHRSKICVCDFGPENHKSKFVFLILGWAGLGMKGWGGFGVEKKTLY